jgi:glycine cleavage system H protein
MPTDRAYTSDHEWVLSGESSMRIGITDYAADALGDVVFLDLPEVGATVTAGEVCGEIESTKTVSDLVAPVSGRVVAVNAAAMADPAVVNQDPHGQGWLLEVEADGAAVELLDALAYQALVE